MCSSSGLKLVTVILGAPLNNPVSPGVLARLVSLRSKGQLRSAVLTSRLRRRRRSRRVPIYNLLS